MDVLRNQIIERKVIDLILANAVFKEVPYQIEESDVAAFGIDGCRRRPLKRYPAAKPGGVAAAEGHEGHDHSKHEGHSHA